MIEHAHHVSWPAIVFVSSAYLVIAADFFYSAKKKSYRTKAGISCALLMAIFILCDVNGYLSTILIHWFDWVAILREYGHWLLGTFAWGFVLFRGSKHIADSL
jgi:hypothetical protein